MSENEIKPVAWRYRDEAILSHDGWHFLELPPLRNYAEVEPLYDQAAIDRLTAELAALRTESMRYRELIEYALAQHNGLHSDHNNHWAAKAMNELASIDAAHAKER